LKPGTVSFASSSNKRKTWSAIVTPYVVNWEECQSRTFTPAEQKIFFTKFSMNALLRGDSSRAGLYATF
jgi:hypothetical protein